MSALFGYWDGLLHGFALASLVLLWLRRPWQASPTRVAVVRLVRDELAEGAPEPDLTELLNALGLRHVDTAPRPLRSRAKALYFWRWAARARCHGDPLQACQHVDSPNDNPPTAGLN